MTDERNAKAWPRVFADGHGLFGALLALLENVDGQVGPAGGHIRELYAASLDEAAVALDAPALAGAARAWRAVADQWEGGSSAGGTRMQCCRRPVNSKFWPGTYSRVQRRNNCSE